MKTIALIVCLLAIEISVFSQKTFYISNDGSDTNNGTSSETAWQTIDRLNVAYQNDELSDGDKILFRKGDIFYGVLDLSMKGYFISSYGSGDKPIISGARNVSGWENQGGNIWRAPFAPEIAPKFLFVNGNTMPMGRYPDDSWLYCDNANGKTQLVDNDFNMPDNHFVNGQCVVRGKRWIIDALRISSNTSTNINMSEDATYDIEDGAGYFIQNHPNTLTFEGEWCFFGDYLYLYSTTDPNSQNIMAPFHRMSVELRYSSGEINGMAFEAYTEYGLAAEWECDNLTISNCDFNYIGRDGMKLDEVSPNLTVIGNTVRNALNLGIRVTFCDSTNIIGNYIENTGMIPGLGRNGNITYEGIYVEGGSEQVIAKNRIINTGYIGIRLNKAPKVKVLNNFIDGACLIKDDGGGIYVRSPSLDPSLAGHTIKGNIITNVTGSIEGSSDQNDLLGHAIYMDDNTESVLIEGNTIFENTKAFYIHNARDIVFTGNTLHNNRDGIFINNNNSVNMINISILSNVFSSITDAGIYEVVPYNLRNYAIRVRAGVDLLDASRNNNFDYNIYCTPFYTEDYIAIDCPDDRTGRYNVEQFRTNTAYAEHSTTGPVQWSASMGIAKADFVVFDYALEEPKEISFDGYFLSPDGTLHYNQVVIEPYHSIVLFKENKQLVTELIPVGESEICEPGAQESYTFTQSGNYSNYTWELIPEEAGEIVSESGTSVSIQFSSEYSGKAILRINACNTSNECNYASSPLIINISPSADFSYEVYDKTVSFFSVSSGDASLEWDFGDGNTSTEQFPEHTYETLGVYDVTLTVHSSSCGDIKKTVKIDLQNPNASGNGDDPKIYPNPAKSYIRIEVGADFIDGNVRIYNLRGKIVYDDRLVNQNRLEIAFLPPGFYMLEYQSSTENINLKFVKL